MYAEVAAPSDRARAAYTWITPSGVTAGSGASPIGVRLALRQLPIESGIAIGMSESQQEQRQERQQPLRASEHASR